MCWPRVRLAIVPRRLAPPPPPVHEGNERTTRSTVDATGSVGSVLPDSDGSGASQRKSVIVPTGHAARCTPIRTFATEEEDSGCLVVAWHAQCLCLCDHGGGRAFRPSGASGHCISKRFPHSPLSTRKMLHLADVLTPPPPYH